MTPDEILPPLSAYAVSEVTGFVPATDPLDRLPGDYAAWEAIVPHLSALIRSRRLREVLRELPRLDPLRLASDRERERALLLLTVFTNGWVWGGDAPDLRLPPEVAVPVSALARAMGRPPIVHYASMALNNWCRVDPDRAIEAGNLRMQVQFLGGVDEDWFFIGSLGVELAGAALIAATRRAVIASHGEGDGELAQALEAIAAAMDPVVAALVDLRAWCDPYIFYHRVRPFLTGWPAPGAVYTGVDETPQVHVGGSAGQSSLIQAVDAALGIEHRPDATARYLQMLRAYMPPPHRRLVEDIEARSRVRPRVAAGSPALAAAYNRAVAQVDRFRREHISLATGYIVRPSGDAPGGKGTGGTDFERFLGSAQASTAGARL